MSEHDVENQRIPWIARINIRPASRERVIAIARAERVAIATIIGYALDQYLTARSST